MVDLGAAATFGMDQSSSQVGSSLTCNEIKELILIWFGHNMRSSIVIRWIGEMSHQRTDYSPNDLLINDEFITDA